MRKLLIVASAVAGLLVVAVVGLWMFLDANQFRPQLESAMSGALGRKVSIGGVKIALFSGGVAIEDLSISDDPAFSAAPFVTAKAVSVGVDLMPLILSRSLHVTSFHLEEPQVTLLNSPSGQWNFSGLGARGDASSNATPSGSAAAMGVAVQKLEIANGRILVGTPGVRGKERVYDSVNLEVTNLSLTSQFPFRLTAKTPGGGTITLDGAAGPVNLSDAADTPFHATAEVSHLDVASTGFIDPASGLAGVIDFAGEIASEAGRLSSKGTLNANGIQLAPGGSPARTLMQIAYESDYTRKTKTGVIKQGDVHIGKAVAHLVGNYNAGAEVVAVRLRLMGEKMPAADLQAALPAIGIVLPSGASLTQGALQVNLAINGPVDHLVIAGPIALENATLAGFDLGGKLSALPSFSGASKGSGDATLIQTLSAALRVAPDGIRIDSLNLVAPAIGALTGAGTIAPTGDLNFRMLAKLTGGAAISQVSRIGSLGQPANGIPFRIQGSTANPVFVPDVGRAVGNAAGGLVKNPDAAKKATGALGGLFGGKKQ